MRILWKCLGYAVLAAVLALVVDSVVWQLKLSKGQGFGSVEVSHITVATLKGSKEEYDFDGKSAVQCSRSVLPMPTSQGLFTPCWWLERHRSVEERY